MMQFQLSSYHGTFILTARIVFEHYLAQAVILAGTLCMLSIDLDAEAYSSANQLYLSSFLVGEVEDESIRTLFYAAKNYVKMLHDRLHTSKAIGSCLVVCITSA